MIVAVGVPVVVVEVDVLVVEVVVLLEYMELMELLELLDELVVIEMGPSDEKAELLDMVVYAVEIGARVDEAELDVVHSSQIAV